MTTGDLNLDQIASNSEKILISLNSNLNILKCSLISAISIKTLLATCTALAKVL